MVCVGSGTFCTMPADSHGTSRRNSRMFLYLWFYRVRPPPVAQDVITFHFERSDEDHHHRRSPFPLPSRTTAPPTIVLSAIANWSKLAIRPNHVTMSACMHYGTGFGLCFMTCFFFVLTFVGSCHAIQSFRCIYYIMYQYFTAIMVTERSHTIFMRCLFL
jgi:hypothetical protein